MGSGPASRSSPARRSAGPRRFRPGPESASPPSRPGPCSSPGSPSPNAPPQRTESDPPHFPSPQHWRPRGTKTPPTRRRRRKAALTPSPEARYRSASASLRSPPLRGLAANSGWMPSTWCRDWVSQRPVIQIGLVVRAVFEGSSVQRQAVGRDAHSVGVDVPGDHPVLEQHLLVGDAVVVRRSIPGCPPSASTAASRSRRPPR